MEITFDVWLKLGSRIQELRSQQYCVLPLAPHLSYRTALVSRLRSKVWAITLKVRKIPTVLLIKWSGTYLILALVRWKQEDQRFRVILTEEWGWASLGYKGGGLLRRAGVVSSIYSIATTAGQTKFGTGSVCYFLNEEESKLVVESTYLMVVADYKKGTSLPRSGSGYFFQRFKAKVNYLTVLFTWPTD